MKILFLSHRVPYPPNKGDKIRSYQVLRYLAKRHEITLACLIENKADLRDIQMLNRFVPNVIYKQLNPFSQRFGIAKSLFTSKPLTVAHFWSRSLYDQIKLLVHENSFDAIYVFSSSMAEYVQGINVSQKIVDFCDLDSQKYTQYSVMKKPPMSWIYKLESRRLAKYEKDVIKKFDYTILIGPEEKKLLEDEQSHNKILLMSNGVDLKGTNGKYNFPAYEKPHLVFVGAMDYIPNIDAAYWYTINVFSVLKKIVPNLHFYIIGRNPPRKIRNLHNPEGGVFVTGFLNDIDPYMANARVFVAPMRIARGMQTKILEAMSYGIPVITSPASARGIGARAGKEIIIAQTASEYIRRTLFLLFNKKARDRIRLKAFEFLENNFKWDRNLELLNNLLDEKNVQ